MQDVLVKMEQENAALKGKLHEVRAAPHRTAPCRIVAARAGGRSERVTSLALTLSEPRPGQQRAADRGDEAPQPRDAALLRRAQATRGKQAAQGLPPRERAAAQEGRRLHPQVRKFTLISSILNCGACGACGARCLQPCACAVSGAGRDCAAQFFCDAFGVFSNISPGTLSLSREGP
jgi:hypothetical protein